MTAIMTSFKPDTNGFNFKNHFKNDFIPALDIRTSGLCGGMSYAALDYYHAHLPIPGQWFRPANKTPLHTYLYDRQVTSIVSNLDKWSEVNFNPGGARNTEFFNWGISAKKGERIDELTRAAAAEGVREGAPIEARMALARFLLRNEFAPEALGALRFAAVNQGELVEIDPEYRLMRGAANVMLGRLGAAQADLSAASLADNPSAALWRGYAAAQRKEAGIDAKPEAAKTAAAKPEAGGAQPTE